MTPSTTTRRRSRRRIGFAVAATAVTVIGVAAAGMTAASAAASGPITGFGGKCVDVAGANPANGTAVQLWTCNGTNAQTWTVANTDNSIQALGKCLDVTAASTADGAKVQLYDCNGTGAQKWTATNGQLINTNSGKCLDATGVSSADGTRLQIWTCGGGANQKWTLPGSGPTNPPTSTPPTTNPPGPGVMAAAPYLYEGWGNPPNPTTVMNATGVRWFTMAFMLNNGNCNPLWDGGRSLTGGVDQSTINTIRANGGDVVISFGGASGPWLEHYCTSATALAAAYQKVISTYNLKAIDIDIEGTPYNNATDQQKTVDALKIIKANNPGIVEYITLGSGTTGPDASLINRAAAAGLVVDGWGIMTFDWGNSTGNQGVLTTQAADGLKNRLKTAYGWNDDTAYRHVGISSMNGITDEGARVTVADFQTILAYAQQHHIARFTYWSQNRDRPCPGAYPNDDTCSGVSQNAWDFTRVVAQYKG
ncbi:ricin-type beta-trefoil lectin domain protein [Dactylosporangium sp. CA-139066]|uniref:ricin-type beta-trefoil lectin domain protein n=1 Tax=Dactylosporangium sp. CA-139066 TaxID=3239930 RepID=UPI003D8D4587